METVQAYGRASSQYFKSLAGTGGLYEIRVNAHHGDLRLLGFFAPRSQFVLTHGFLKKTQSTPLREIAVAQHRRKDYLTRNGYEA
jgi:phage-related protein